jgi:PIN domain nuclease of toxin-antitoxin system
MGELVLDASAVLAYLQQEAGWERVESALLADRCALLSVNLAEVLSRLADWGVPLDEAQARLNALDLDVVAFDGSLARLTAALRPLTRALGLSLGDRACLALAQHRDLIALTADRGWTRLEPSLGVRVESIRP